MRKILSIKRSSNNKTMASDIEEKMKQFKMVQNNLKNNVFKKPNNVASTNIINSEQKDKVKVEEKRSMQNTNTTLSKAKDIYAYNKSFINSNKQTTADNTDNNLYLLNIQRSAEQSKKPGYVTAKRRFINNKYSGGTERKTGFNTYNKSASPSNNSGRLRLNNITRSNSVKSEYKPRTNIGMSNRVNSQLDNSKITQSIRSKDSQIPVNRSSIDITNKFTMDKKNAKKTTSNTYAAKKVKKDYSYNKKPVEKNTNAVFIKTRKMKRRTSKIKKKLVITWDYDLNCMELATLLQTDKAKVLQVLQNIDSSIDYNTNLKYDTVELVVEEFGHTPNYVLSQDNINYYWPKDNSKEYIQEEKMPVIAFFGHVDHGKTTLIQNCINSKFLTKEYGGMSQNITGYNIGDFSIIDTPGHSVLHIMRDEVMKMIDVAILVIAGNEGIKEQTEECLKGILENNKKLIVVINKVDLSSPEDIESIKDDLLEREIDIIDKVPLLEISATKGKNFSQQLSKALDKWRSEILLLKSNYTIGYVLDSQLDIRQGVKTTLMVLSGEIKNKDVITTSTVYGRVKGIFDYSNQKMKVAKSGDIVTVLGLKGVANIGEKFVVVESDKLAAEITTVKSKAASDMSIDEKNSLEDLFDDIDKQQYNFIIKGFNYAVLQALSKEIKNIKSETHDINICAQGVGPVTESDIKIIRDNGVIYCLQQKKVDKDIIALAKQKNIIIKHFDIIFDLLNDIKDIVIVKEDSDENKVKHVGIAKVLKIFALSDKKTVVAGCRISSGSVHKKHKAVVLRDDKELFKGNIISIKFEKDDLNEVSVGKECGIVLKGFNEFKEGDVIKVYNK